MKGQNKFYSDQIMELKSLITQRVHTDSSKQKGIRYRMRKIGFYVSDFGITNLQPSDFDNLIKSGIVKVLDQKTACTKETIITKSRQIVETKIIQDPEGQFSLFDPAENILDKIPNSSGNYIVCLKKGSELPDVGVEFEMTMYQGFQVIYTGVAGTSLRKRGYQQHFIGNNAGSSTLRKSLGSLFGYPKIPRDKNASNGKTKFNISDEIKLSEWMIKNLLLYLKVSPNPHKLENELISILNPPLNLSKNKNFKNKPFRNNLSQLRKKK